VINQVRGILQAVGEEELTLAVGSFQLEVMIPESARRRLQSRLEEPITLHIVFDIEGNQMAGRLRPRLIGFLSPIDREFFEVFCSVDGVGVRKALRAMVRPVRELARAIEDQDHKALAMLPGIGEATAERIVAKLRRKVGKFALIVEPKPALAEAVAQSNGAAARAEPDVIQDVFAMLLSVGHTESQARQLIDDALSAKKKFRNAADMIEAIYQRNR
jgi:Holliday junction DNA helicase RuvA